MNRPVARLLLPLLLLVAAGTAGCTARADSPAGPTAAAPFADCSALNAGPAAPSAGSGGGAGKALPDLELPCFTGGVPVRLTELRGPAVVNLWGSWCAPCRKELPAFQRLAQRGAGTVRVIGVDTRDDRDAAASLADDLGLTFPTLYDPGERLRLQLGIAGLPGTLFVDAAGRIRHLDNTGALDDRALDSLVREHLGVAVPA